MGKISQADALAAARKIAEPISQKAVEVEKELQEYITEVWKEGIPADVMKMYKKHPEYIQTTGHIEIKGVGITTGRGVGLIGQWPTHNSNYCYEHELNKEQSKVAYTLIERKKELEKKYTETKDEIEQTILNLGTHKRVLDEFPEAYGALPGVNTSAALTVQIQPLRDKVKCLVSPEKEKKCMEAIIK